MLHTTTTLPTTVPAVVNGKPTLVKVVKPTLVAMYDASVCNWVSRVVPAHRIADAANGIAPLCFSL